MWVIKFLWLGLIALSVSGCMPNMFWAGGKNITEIIVMIRASTIAMATNAAATRVVRKMDDADSGVLFPANSTSAVERVGFFSVFKSLGWDRLILNPTAWNGRCRRVNRYARTLGHGFLLVFLHLRRYQRGRASGDNYRNAHRRRTSGKHRG